MTNIQGKILKSVGGFFYTETSDNLLQCTARGLFRLKEIAPCAGDNVIIDTNETTPVITEVLERKNYIVRPPLANLDVAIIVISTVEPAPNMLILNKLIAIFESKNIEPVPLFTKTDRKKDEELANIYKQAGFTVFSVNNTDSAGIVELKSFLLKGSKTFAFIGNTGVGKSSTLNSLFPELMLETAEISKKLGRGKHTTRQIELYPLGNNSYIADTPGFSTVEAAKYGKLPSCDVALYFREFAPLINNCKFGGCRHTREEGCAVIAAVNSGIITQSRFDSYIKIFEDAKIAEQIYK